MNEARKQELKRLLGTAMAHLEIRKSEGQTSHTSVDEYRGMLQHSWNRPYAYARDAYKTTSSHIPHVTDDNTRLALLNFIREELKEFIHEDRILSASFALFGGRHDGYKIDMFMKHLLNIAIYCGVGGAVLSFIRSTEARIPFQHMALLEGILVDKEIQVYEGIKLVPLSYERSELPSYLPMIRDTLPTSFTGKTLLVIDASISPIFKKPPSEFGELTFQVQIRGKPLKKQGIADFCEKFCHSLSLVCNTPVQISLSWHCLSPKEFFNVTHCLAILQAMRNVVTTIINPKKIEKPEVGNSVSLYEVMEKSDVVKKLRIPIYRWIASQTQKNYADKIIDLSIAFEAVYLFGVTSRSELSFRLALRVARYLGENKEERKELFEEVKLLYNCRSKVVHGSMLNYMVDLDKRSIGLQELTERAQSLCKKSILKILKEGKFPDWDDLIHS